MGIIKQLDPLEARKIAAGEVIERPVNIIKELIENSIDADAKNIIINLKHGGLEYISITDDGHGIYSTDIENAFKHHYTSKIKCLDDLWSINSYGFRGEALSSIAAISNVTMFSKHQSETKATCFKTGPNIPNEISVTSRSTGTTIIIDKLFENVPARKKFQKTAETEYRLIHQLVQNFALNYPNIYFEIKHNEKISLQITVSDEKNRVYNTLELKDNSLCNIKIAEKAIELNCWFSSPEITKYNRQSMIIFVNNRPVKNNNILKAVIRGYGTTLGDKFPYAVVKIKVDSNLVDVNVHPKKEEVKFANEGHLLSLLTQVTSKALQNRSQQILGNSIKSIKDNINYQANIDKADFNNHAPISNNNFAINNFYKQDKFASKIYYPNTPSDSNVYSNIQTKIDSYERNEEIEQSNYLGSLENTYLLFSTKEGLLILDQHAAHERVTFEAIEKYFGNPTTIDLIFPLIINTADMTNWFICKQNIFQKLGINFEQIEEQKIAIKAIPVYLKNKRIDEIFDEIAEENNKLSVNEKQIENKVLHLVQSTIACKAAVKAGDILTTTEAEKLLKDLKNCQNSGSCPHGRPTSYLYQIKDIAKEFRRFI